MLKRLGENIRRLRGERGLSQDRLATEAGVDRSYMGMIERGESIPTVVALLKVAKALEVPAAALLEGVELEDDEAT